MNKEKVTLLGNNIIYLCKKKGINRRILAEEIGVTETSMSRYIYGIRSPKYQIISIIAAYFNTTVEKLTGEDLTKEYDNELDTIDKSIDEYFDLIYYNTKEISKRLTPEQKLKLISVIL
jgi:transcriptional regulator with XRE-family HTH domain